MLMNFYQDPEIKFYEAAMQWATVYAGRQDRSFDKFCCDMEWSYIWLICNISLIAAIEAA